MDGIAVLRWLQAENCCRNTRIFALSSMKGEEAIQLGESLGVTYQIQMPTDTLDRVLNDGFCPRSRWKHQAVSEQDAGKRFELADR